MTVRDYGVFGPCDIPRSGSGHVNDERLTQFWEDAEAMFIDELSGASGCYIFGIRAGKGATPWYVGQAKHSFKRECFTDRNLRLYDKILRQRKGTPILFLLARKTPKGKFQKRLGEAEANRLENLLIDQCLQANSNLLNKRGTAFLKEARIPGLLNSPPGPHSQEARSLRRLLNIKT